METPPSDSEEDKIIALFWGLAFEEKQEVYVFFQKPEAERTQQDWLGFLAILGRHLSEDDDSIHLTRVYSDYARRFVTWKREEVQDAQRRIQVKVEQELSRALEGQ